MGVRYLELDDLLAAATAFLAATPEVRDFGLLESALARPKASVFGEDAYPTLVEKAAALVQSLVANHALVDGNKRLGYAGLLLFLERNGLTLKYDDDDDVDFILAIADGRLREVAEIALRLSDKVTPFRR